MVPIVQTKTEKGNKTMVLPIQSLRAIGTGENPMITSDYGIDDDQFQPASIDCRLGSMVYGMEASALPSSKEKVEDLIKSYHHYKIELPEGETTFLYAGKCYLIPMRERVNFAQNMFATFSPKSSTGRCDVFVRVLTDNFSGYDRTVPGYSGGLYLELIPLSFDIRVAQGLSLTQLRMKSVGDKLLSDDEISIMHSQHGIAFSKNGKVIPNGKLKLNNGLFFHVDLDRDIVGFEASGSSTKVIDLTMVDKYNPADFWIPIMRPKDGVLVLEPGKFYLLATRERIKIPPECCAEMLPYDVSTGEFRTHYAGFFDNGFGSKNGTVGVLEVRTHTIPLRLTDGQSICRMVFERTDGIPDDLYDGNYTGSGPSLSKHYKKRNKVWR